jgi:release factor glutamine methyltransferase
MTLRQAITAAATELAANPHLRDTAHRDAELLLLHTLQIRRSTLLAYPDRDLSPAQQTLFETSITRRLTLEPIQYITGQQEFFGLTLHVTPAVLIPRPETEHLVEAVIEHFSKDLSKPLQIADIGTGSGAIAIALASHLPEATITALDLSPAALAIATQNARTHNLSHRIRFLESDLLAAIPNTFDAIVSNPPYIPDTDGPTLHPQVRDYEPSTALFAGPNGLDIYRRLIPQALAALKPNGLIALEIGHGQHHALTQLLADWNEVAFINDLQQIPRVALARKP